MAPLSRLAAGLIALACLSSAAHAAVTKVPHRTAACEKAKDGWCTASASDGSFRVSMPMPFNEFTLLEPGAFVPRTLAMGCGTTDGIRFMAARTFYTGGAAAARSTFDKIGVDDGKLGKVVSLKHGKVDGHDAVDFVAESDQGRLHMRTVLLGDSMIGLTAFMPPGADARYPGAVDQFIESLHVTAR